MAEPVDAILAFHNAFRKDLEQIDNAAFSAAKGKTGPDPAIGRFRFLNEILVWHASGEEAAVFPAIDSVAPLVAEPYLMDHHGLDAAFEELNTSYASQDSLKTARATAAFRFHLNMHLGKEDAHLYRIFRQRISIPDQNRILGVMAGKIPPDRAAEVVIWLFSLIGQDDRENMIRIYQKMMPDPVFAKTSELIKKTIGNDWAGLVRRIPALK